MRTNSKNRERSSDAGHRAGDRERRLGGKAPIFGKDDTPPGVSTEGTKR